MSACFMPRACIVAPEANSARKARVGRRRVTPSECFMNSPPTAYAIDANTSMSSAMSLSVIGNQRASAAIWAMRVPV